MLEVWPFDSLDAAVGLSHAALAALSWKGCWLDSQLDYSRSASAILRGPEQMTQSSQMPALAPEDAGTAKTVTNHLYQSFCYRRPKKALDDSATIST